ncbi:MAG: class I SAM-dependent methyltransferase [Candidatus Thorarchaeota archaeon]
MSPERTPELFDSWASSYDYFIEAGKDSFPFLGYDDVLSRVVDHANPEPGMKILDVGIGTGCLAVRFSEFDCEIWGIDYSSRMLEEARKKVPNAQLLHVDVRSEWPPQLSEFDRVVSAYTLHHLTLEDKTEAVQRMANELLKEGGRIIIADISFPTVKTREQARKKLGYEWDDDEYYWAADEFKIAGMDIAYEQVSRYGGVYIITP